jgi:hypothetical protein
MTVTTAPTPLTLEWFKNNCDILDKGISPGLSSFPLLLLISFTRLFRSFE